MSNAEKITPIVPIEKRWIGPGKRLERHTVGRLDAIAKVALFAILTVAATVKLVGRVAILAGKTICCMDTDQTKHNLVRDALFAANCFERIFRSVWRVLSASKLKDTGAIDSGVESLKILTTVNYKSYNVYNPVELANMQIGKMIDAYIEPTGQNKKKTETPKKRLCCINPD